MRDCSTFLPMLSLKYLSASFCIVIATPSATAMDSAETEEKLQLIYSTSCFYS